METRYCLVMAGGQGTRLWPLSTKECPKQFHKLGADRTLIQSTIDRFDGLVDKKNRFIISVLEQKKLLDDQVGSQIAGTILEPEGRNTAPCILLALASLLEQGASSEDLLAIVPSDHVIKNQSGFQKTLTKAFELAKKEQEVVIIGIRPTSPHTGYGYIKSQLNENNFGKVESFKEKPDEQTAKKYLDEGCYLWNAGMFVGPLGVFLSEFEKHAPDMYSYLDLLRKSLKQPEQLAEVYGKIRKESVDYTLWEKSQRVSVIPAEFDWNDLGSWDALDSDVETENHFICEDYFSLDSQKNIVLAQDKFVALIGVEDLIVVEGKKGLLIMPRSRAQDVKKVIGELEKTGKREFL